MQTKLHNYIWKNNSDLCMYKLTKVYQITLRIEKKKMHLKRFLSDE